jgi:hypothetical protein
MGDSAVSTLYDNELPRKLRRIKGKVFAHSRRLSVAHRFISRDVQKWTFPTGFMCSLGRLGLPAAHQRLDMRRPALKCDTLFRLICRTVIGAGD